MNAAAAELLGTPPRRRMIEWVPYSRHNHGTEHSSRHLQLKGSCKNAENEHGNTICYDYKKGIISLFYGIANGCLRILERVAGLIFAQLS
ncbi:hypothetical protein CEXT_42051 [Caerostris extrusa]|uniref:Uncharacterized protein n=1 Tax=Caerostris extrusa TaxID=172846 RepID=A0AAV4Y7U3_CAEEX|nr:hypothetical protein CEXT_42051 [Caerostris extrusa]